MKTKHAHNRGKRLYAGYGYSKSNPRLQSVTALSLSIAVSAMLALHGQMNQGDLISPVPEHAYSVFTRVEKVYAAETEKINPETKWDEFVSAVDKLSPQYGYPKNVILAQGALESGRGTSRFAQERNNFLGIAAYDHNPDNATGFKSAEDCVKAYMELIQKTFPEAWENRNDPSMLLYRLKHNSNGKMYATDRNYIEKVMSMKEWNQ